MRDLKARANEANEQGNVLMLAVYAELVRTVSPTIQRLRARIERESAAAINKDLKAQRLAHRNGATAGA